MYPGNRVPLVQPRGNICIHTYLPVELPRWYVRNVPARLQCQYLTPVCMPLRFSSKGGFVVPGLFLLGYLSSVLSSTVRLMGCSTKRSGISKSVKYTWCDSVLHVCWLSPAHLFATAASPSATKNLRQLVS